MSPQPPSPIWSEDTTLPLRYFLFAFSWWGEGGATSPCAQTCGGSHGGHWLGLPLLPRLWGERKGLDP